MSQRLFIEDVQFTQRFLRFGGFNPGLIDGDWGPKTEAAYEQFEENSLAIRNEIGAFDSRSEGHILTLIPDAQRICRQCLKIWSVEETPVIRVISGTRSYEEQNALFRKGRYGNPGPRVTNARGGQSNHNFGLAWDIGIFVGKQYITSGAPYVTASQKVNGVVQKLAWGGDWKSFPDIPHYQMKTNLTSSALRSMFESGQPLNSS